MAEQRIKKEPVITMALRKRVPILPRPFREDILIRLELIERKLRNPEFFADVAAGTILSRLFGKIPVIIPPGFGQKVVREETWVI